MYAQSSNVKIFRGGVRALIACIIAFAVVFTQIKVEAFAGTEEVSYYDRNTGNTQSVSAEIVEATSTAWNGATKWYVVKDNITINDRITVTGDVHLILADNAVLRANSGIEVSEGSSLTIYAQTAEVTLSTGKIIAGIQGNPDSAAIGGNNGKACGTIKITGGDISTALALNGAAIGGGKGGSCGTITITGGVVTAKLVEQP